MSNPEESQAFKLGLENERKIDGIKERFEQFALEQKELNLNLKHEMELVVKGQDQVKERMEMGIGKTVKKIDDSLDRFFIEWGQKKRDDELRDKRIDEVKLMAEKGVASAMEEAKEARKPWERVANGAMLLLVSAFGIAFIVWAVRGFPMP